MENIRVFEEDGYIHFILRPEELMRLRYSTEAKTPFADFMDRWLTQMKTQVRENTMDGYRYAFEKHIKPFFTARALILTMIPIVNIIMLFVWAFSNGTNPTKANWAKAALILILVWIILGIIFGGYFMRMFYGNYPTY